MSWQQPVRHFLPPSCVPPGCRYVCPGELLAPYDWQEAMGRWLLAELDRQRLGDPAEAAAAQDAFVLCVPAAANGHYLVATTTKVGFPGSDRF